MSRPKVSTADLTGDGLIDVVISSQLGGEAGGTPGSASASRSVRTTYEVLLLVNTGTPGVPSFTTVLRDQTTPYVDPFTEIRDQQGDCGCNGCACCSDFFRTDGFSSSNDCSGSGYNSFENGFHGNMRSMSVQLVDLVGPNDVADGLVDLVLGNVCYQNIGTASWPRYSESTKIELAVLGSNTADYANNYATEYTFADFDKDGDLDAVVTKQGLGDKKIHLLQNFGTAGTPSFNYWGVDVDTASSPHITELLPSWGGAVAVFDFDNDGREDVLVGGDALFSNRGTFIPLLQNLAEGTKMFAGTPMSRDTLTDYTLHAVRNFTGAQDDDRVHILWVQPKENNNVFAPTLRWSSQMIARDEPYQMLTPWDGKRDFADNDPAANRPYGRSGWFGIRLSNAADMNGDGRSDWITSAGKIFLGAPLSASLDDPAFVYWAGKDIYSWSNDLNNEVTNLPAQCVNQRTREIVYGPGDVNNDGLQDLFVGGGNSFNQFESQDCWTSANVLEEHVRLTYLKNIGTLDAPAWQRIKHGDALYPLGDAVFVIDIPGRVLTPTFGDVNGDGFQDLLVSQSGSRVHGIYGFDCARLFLNNGDGTFTEDLHKSPYNRRMLPTNEQLRAANSKSPIYFGKQNFQPFVLVDFTGDGFSDLFISSGDERLEGALFVHKRSEPSGAFWDGTKTTNSVVVGEQDPSSSECALQSAYPIGHMFFDTKRQLAWRVFPVTGGDAPQVQMYTMLPRCKLPGATKNGGTSVCGLGVCASPDPDVVFGLKCQCGSSYLGSPSTLPLSFNAYCATCTPGSVNEAYSVCAPCQAGTFSNKTYSSFDHAMRSTDVTCVPCGVGKIGPVVGSPSISACIECPSGRFSNTASARTMSECIECELGLYSLAGDAACRSCKKGQYNSERGSASCFPCIPGEHQNEIGQTSCKMCQANEKSETASSVSCEKCGIGEKSDPGSAKCLKCDAGEAGTGENGICESCDKGRYRPSKDATGQDTESDVCLVCEAGYYQNQEGQASCLPCIPGTYNDQVGQKHCQPCPLNTVSLIPLSKSCQKCPIGRTTSSNGSTTCSSCMPGTHLSNNVCIRCDVGEYSEQQDVLACETCPTGFYSSDKRSTCLGCELGKYKSNISIVACETCPSGFYQDTRSSTQCKTCADKTEIPNSAKTACEKPGWKTITDCTRGLHFLDDESENKKEWTCRNCPAGSACVNRTTVKDLVNQADWWLVPVSWKDKVLFQPSKVERLMFQKCPIPGSCPTPFTNCSRSTMGILCASCRSNHFQTSRGCQKCNAATVGTQLSLLVGVLLLFVLIFFVCCKRRLRRFRRKYAHAYHDVLRIVTIFVSYSQVNASLPILIDVAWPAAYLAYLESWMSWVNVDFVGLLGLNCLKGVDFRLQGKNVLFVVCLKM